MTEPIVWPGMDTPWDKADDVEVVSDHMGWVHTHCHGGIKLSDEWNAKVPPLFRRAGGWYEEDCEWALVALCFPAHFSEKERGAAEAIVKMIWGPKSCPALKQVQTQGSKLCPQPTDSKKGPKK